MFYKFDKEFQFGEWEVKIDTGAQYGYFQHQGVGTEGGLYFEVSAESTGGDSGRKLVLIDMDGVMILPKVIVEGLRAEGYILCEDFD